MKPRTVDALLSYGIAVLMTFSLLLFIVLVTPTHGFSAFAANTIPWIILLWIGIPVPDPSHTTIALLVIPGVYWAVMLLPVLALARLRGWMVLLIEAGVLAMNVAAVVIYFHFFFDFPAPT